MSRNKSDLKKCHRPTVDVGRRPSLVFGQTRRFKLIVQYDDQAEWTPDKPSQMSEVRPSIRLAPQACINLMRFGLDSNDAL